MSISVGGLVLAVAYSQDANTILAGLIAGGALAVGWAAGAIRVTRIAGPIRLPDDAPVLPFASILFGSFGFFILVANIVMKAGSADGTAPTDFRSALGACLPPIAGLAAIWLGDRAILPFAGQKLGLSARFIPRGVLIGVLASLVVLPVLFFTSDVADRIYRQSGYQHDAEHPMLRAMAESPSTLARLMLAFGACVIVPIWEEAFFRGHLQTLLRSAFSRMLSEPPEYAGSLSTSTETNRPVPLQYQPVPLPTVVRYPNVASWIAVIITSALFAILHPLWTVPIIFLLALGLGYAYERTGNLWVSIAMHATFNSISTFWFLLHGPGN